MGVIADQDAASVTIVDANNQRTKILRNEIDELHEAEVSLMPERLLEKLTPQELRDLFAYLRSPGAVGSRVVAYRLSLKNGKAVRRERLSDDTYRAMDRVLITGA